MVEISFRVRPSWVVCSPVTAVTVTSLLSSVPEFVMNSLRPSITQCPSTSAALVFVPPASDPASGSVNPKPASACPETNIGNHSCFWASVPKRKTGIAPRETPASSVIATD